MHTDLSCFESDLNALRACSLESRFGLPQLVPLIDDLEEALIRLRRVYGEQGATVVVEKSNKVWGDGIKILRKISSDWIGREFTVPQLLPMLEDYGWRSKAKEPMESVRTIVRRTLEGKGACIEKIGHGLYRFVDTAPV